MGIENKYKYFAFISYKREDEEWAIWLQHEIEYYHLPALLNGREDLPKVFRPVFRDIDELKAGNLPEQIYDALASSAHLIVICSPRSANSPWVNKEIETFIEIGKERGINNLDHIFPFIVEGTPRADDKSQECFPKVLRDLPADQERIGGNVNEGNVNEYGRDKAFIKVMAGMLPNVGIDMLWNRYERDKAEEERRKREERDKLLIMQSRFISEKANDLVNQNSYLARLLAIEALPKDLSDPDRPYTIEAEAALRKACRHNCAILKGHSNVVHSVSFSPDGKHIVSASADNTVRIWDTETGKTTKVLSGHTDHVNFATFSPNGKHIVSASNDQTIRIWDTTTGKTLKILEGHTAYVNSAAYSPNGEFIVSASHDNTVLIWDVERGLVLITLGGHTGAVYSATFSPDGKRIVSASGDNSIRIWDVETGKAIHILKGHTSFVTSVAFSPDGKLVVSASWDDTVRIWDAETGWELHELKGQNDHDSSTAPLTSMYAAAFSPNGKYVVSASADKTVRLWNAETGEELRTLKGHSSDVRFAAISPDGKRIVSASVDLTIRLWDADTDMAFHILKGHNAVVNYATFSSDGKRVASTAYDKTIRVWDVETGKELNVINTETGIEINQLEGFDVNLTIHSPDGKYAVSISDDNNICIHDTTTGIEINQLEGHISYINSVVFSPNGKYLVSASWDDTVRIWDFPPLQKLIDQTRERFKDRPLTDEERRMYYLE